VVAVVKLRNSAIDITSWATTCYNLVGAMKLLFLFIAAHSVQASETLALGANPRCCGMASCRSHHDGQSSAGRVWQMDVWMWHYCGRAAGGNRGSAWAGLCTDYMHWVNPVLVLDNFTSTQTGDGYIYTVHGEPIRFGRSIGDVVQAAGNPPKKWGFT
jgi:hypothetical protein